VLHSGLQHIHLLLTPPTVLAWGALDDSPIVLLVGIAILWGLAFSYYFSAPSNWKVGQAL